MLFYNLGVYFVHRIPVLFALIWFSLVHTCPISLTSILILSSHNHLRITIVVFFKVFQSKFCMCAPLLPLCATYASYVSDHMSFLKFLRLLQ